MPNNATVIARVLDRHKIRQVDLADLTGLSESSISRMVNGSATISPEVLRSLWQRTHDHELLAIALGERDAVLIRHEQDNNLNSATQCHRVLAGCGEIIKLCTDRTTRITKAQMINKVDGHIRDLHQFRFSLKPPAQHPRAGIDVIV